MRTTHPCTFSRFDPRFERYSTQPVNVEIQNNNIKSKISELNATARYSFCKIYLKPTNYCLQSFVKCIIRHRKFNNFFTKLHILHKIIKLSHYYKNELLFVLFITHPHEIPVRICHCHSKFKIFIEIKR